jgi:hypothetical protein
MAFRGVLTAPELAPAPCGLLSVAEVTRHSGSEYEERWVRGLAYEFDSQPTVRLLTVLDEAVSGGELFDHASLPEYYEYVPFFIEVEDFSSTFGVLSEDRFAQVKKQLEAATQKAVEVELWDGLAATANSNSNVFLSQSGTTVVGGGTDTVSVGLHLLEQAIANSPTGEQGIIHMTRDVASALDTRIVREKCDGEFKLFTRIGTPVVVGSGYSGSGPVGNGNATPSGTHKWMYATSKVYVDLGKVEVVNEDLAHGIDPTINDIIVKALRPAAAYFDPSIHYAARVALPTA